MKLSSDVGLINSILRTSIGDPDFDFREPDASQFALMNDDETFVLVWTKEHYGTYWGFIGWLPNVGLIKADITQHTLDTVKWMFEFTDAVFVHGEMSTSNLALIRACSAAFANIRREDDAVVQVSWSIAKWARNIGKQAFIDKLTASGQTQKLLKLKTAWETKFGSG